MDFILTMVIREDFQIRATGRTTRGATPLDLRYAPARRRDDGVLLRRTAK
jgi:hypothetical protein